MEEKKTRQEEEQVSPGSQLLLLVELEGQGYTMNKIAPILGLTLRQAQKMWKDFNNDSFNTNSPIRSSQKRAFPSPLPPTQRISRTRSAGLIPQTHAPDIFDMLSGNPKSQPQEQQAHVPLSQRQKAAEERARKKAAKEKAAKDKRRKK